MLSKNKIKFIKSLQQKKFRVESQKFIVEGRKGVLSLLNSSFKVDEVYCSEKISKDYPKILELQPCIVAENDLEKATGLKSNKEAIAIVNFNESSEINWDNLILYLDGVSDPGNLGTIIRTADWFGIQQIVCSTDCVEFYNPKVVQSTMGSFSSIIPVVMDAEDFLKTKPKNTKVYVTDFEGDSPNILNGVQSGVVVMGSESHGVSEVWYQSEHQKITIPSSTESNAESLNVAIATSILCYQIKQV